MSQSDSQFGKYQLLDRIAAGGMAEIYRARLTGAAGVTKSVVIKKILPHYAGNKNFISMFINEAKIAMGLSHGNIAQIFDFGEIDGEYFLAMEYVHGQPLSKVLKRARSLQVPVIPTPFAVLIVMELCKGLHYAHTRLDDAGRPLNIIHRDVSPQNVIVSYEGQVKIVDFGIAKARTAGSAQETEAGAVKGKYVYFAPEQARGKELDARTDTFAAGIVLYELLCGRLPFEGKMIEVLGKIVRGEFPTPRSVNPDITPALERILLTAMAHDKKDRYPTAEAFQEALATYLYKHAPTFSASSLSNLMGYLFEPELVADGRPVQLPRDFLEQVPLWRKVLPEADVPDSSVQVTSAARGRSQSQSREVVEETRSEQISPRMTRRGQRALFIGAPLLAACIAALLVVVVGRLGTFSVKLESRPPGASVTVNGHAGGVTPQLVSNLPASRPHRIEVSAPGMKVWVRDLTGDRGAVLELVAELEPDRLPVDLDKPEKVEPAPEPPKPEPAKNPDDDIPMSAAYPVSSFRVSAKKHVFNVPPSKAARIRLDPKKTYRVWTEGKLSLGGVLDNIYLNEAFYFLEGGERLAARDSFGIVSPRPRLIKGASALYGFIFDASAGDNSGALKIRIQEKGSPQISTVLVNAHEQALSLDNSQRFTVSNLDQLTTYEIIVKDAPDPARTRAGKSGRVGKVAYSQTSGFSVLEGKKWANESERVLEVGKTYQMRGATWMYFTFPDDSEDDNSGALQVELAPLPGSGGMGRGLLGTP